MTLLLLPLPLFPLLPPPTTMRWSAGSKYDRVLPLPVRALATMSLPWRAAGMAAACTGVGELKPCFERARRMRGSNPVSWKLLDMIADELVGVAAGV